MAEISVKISELNPINPATISDNDDLVINDSVGSGVTTKRVKVGEFLSYILNKDLAFKGDITIEGSIQPPAGKELDIVVDNITVKQNLTLNSSATADGLLLNYHLDDVDINSLEEGDGIVWNSTNVKWENQKICEEAPMDGRTYARKDGQWVPIRNIGAEEIGDVVITTNISGSVNQNQTYLFSALHGGGADDITYQWDYVNAFSTGYDVTFSSSTDKTTEVTFNNGGAFIVQCTLTSATSGDSPIIASLAVAVTDFDAIQDEFGRDLKQESGFYVYQG